MATWTVFDVESGEPILTHLSASSDELTDEELRTLVPERDLSQVRCERVDVHAASSAEPAARDDRGSGGAVLESGVALPSEVRYTGID
jgi:hypothetical protein